MLHKSNKASDESLAVPSLTIPVVVVIGNVSNWNNPNLATHG